LTADAPLSPASVRKSTRRGRLAKVPSGRAASRESSSMSDPFSPVSVARAAVARIVADAQLM
jgi:hypothetical protein